MAHYGKFISFIFLKKLHKTSSSCLCCPFKRRRRRSSQKELPQENNLIPPPIHSYMMVNSKNIPNDSIDDSRPPSSASSQNADDIQLIVLPIRRNKIRPHYTLALNRAPRMSPEVLFQNGKKIGRS